MKPECSRRRPINSVSRQGNNWSKALGGAAGKPDVHAENREQKFLRKEHPGWRAGEVD